MTVIFFFFSLSYIFFFEMQIYKIIFKKPNILVCQFVWGNYKLSFSSINIPRIKGHYLPLFVVIIFARKPTKVLLSLKILFIRYSLKHTTYFLPFVGKMKYSLCGFISSSSSPHKHFLQHFEHREMQTFSIFRATEPKYIHYVLVLTMFKEE